MGSGRYECTGRVCRCGGGTGSTGAPQSGTVWTIGIWESVECGGGGVGPSLVGVLFDWCCGGEVIDEEVDFLVLVFFLGFDAVLERFRLLVLAPCVVRLRFRCVGLVCEADLARFRLFLGLTKSFNCSTT